MRHFWIALVIVMILIILAGAGGQTPAAANPPAGPPPAPEPQPALSKPVPAKQDWTRIRDLANGELIKINYGGGPAVRCRFAGATDALLFCDPADAPPGAATFQIDRSRISNVRIDHDERNGRLVLGAFIVAGGLWAGIRSSETTDDGVAAALGFLGAGLGGLVGFPVACLTGYCPNLNFPPPPGYGFNLAVPLGGFGRLRSPLQHWR